MRESFFFAMLILLVSFHVRSTGSAICFGVILRPGPDTLMAYAARPVRLNNGAAAQRSPAESLIFIPLAGGPMKKYFFTLTGIEPPSDNAPETISAFPLTAFIS
jgi:hypothetical protein